MFRSVIFPRWFSAVPSDPAKRKFSPDAILPHQYKHVRVLSNTTRDAQQSNCSAEMAHGHRVKITKMIDECYGRGERQGYEQIWGGTIPMFDIWKRGVNPFDSLRQQIAYLPNTPVSMLFRSNAANSMANLSHGAIDMFVKVSAEAGMNVYTNFDAHNDWRNHIKVAESVLKYGAHYQAALSWAVYNPDPSIYNVQWAVDFFRKCVKLGAHSLYVKDPSGVLTPAMAYALSRQIKEAFPTLPLVFHTHYQAGYGYMTYLKAVEGGANGVECSMGFADGAGQPYTASMLRAFEEAGFHTGSPNISAIRRVTEYCNSIRPKYVGANIMKTPDISVEDSGIAGGQRSILDKELRDVGQAHLIPELDKEVFRVRSQGGKVCQVTPVADTYAREAMRRLRGGSASSGFVPGYASILCGDGGSVKEPVDTAQQHQALLERVSSAVAELVTEKSLPATFSSNTAFHASLVSQMKKLGAITFAAQRREEVLTRISQLQIVAENPELKDQIERQFVTAQNYPGAPAKNLTERVDQLKQEVANLDKLLVDLTPADIEKATSDYESVLRLDARTVLLEKLASENPLVVEFISRKELTIPLYQRLLSRAGVVSCVSASLLPAQMDKSRKFILEMEQKEMLGMTETPRLFEDLVVLHACFQKTALPNLFNNFLRNYRENLAFFPKLFTGHVRSKFTKAPAAKPSGLKLNWHADMEAKIDPGLFSKIIDLKKEINGINDRLYNQTELAKKVFPLEQKDPAAFVRQLAPNTVQLITETKNAKEKRLLELKQTAATQASTQLQVIDDLILYAL